MNLHDRLICIDQNGKPLCISDKAIKPMPSEFGDCLKTLCGDLQLALDCIDVFGGVPECVARTILRNMEPAHTAIDIAIRCLPKNEVH